MPVPPELDEDEIRDLVQRCPEQQRTLFEGWLRGTHHLDGDLIQPSGEEQDQ
jgi:hypothetical protein